MKLKIGFLALFFFVFSMIFVSADYNIPSKYQKTEFNTTNWIQSYHDVIINTTIGKIYLNDYINDFNAYMKFNDTDNRIMITEKNITFIDITRDYESYVYKDLSTINDFNHLFDLEIKDIISTPEDGLTLMMVACISDSLGTYVDFSGDTWIVINILRISGDNNHYKLQIISFQAGILKGYDTSIQLDVNTRYWLRYNRTGSTGKLSIYSDVGRLNLIETLSCTVTSNQLRYIMPITTVGINAFLGNNVTGYMHDYYSIPKIYESTGILYTKNLLQNTTEKSVLIGINATATTDTRVQLFGSPDNSTWKLLIDNDCLGELMQYRDVLYNYSSLYVRLNLTTTDPFFTPFVDELFYFHTYDCAVSDETKPYVFIILFTIIGMLLGYAIDRT